MIEIDGSILEGGGQILRIALSLSSLLTIPIKIVKIRAGRKNSGLAAQHLKGVELLKKMCNATVTGAEIGSTTIEFTPGNIKGGEFSADPKTAGSIALLLQIALPVALFADSLVSLNLRGGTNADMAPQIDFTTEIFRPNLEKFGATFDFVLHKRGYFPKGGGNCDIKILPIKQLTRIDVTNFGELIKVYGWSFVSGILPIKMANEMSDGAINVLKNVLLKDKINIEVYKESPDVTNNANCSGIILVGETTSNCIIGSSALGNRKVTSVETGKNAAEEISNTLCNNACFDQHTQDQIIIFMGLARGSSRCRIGQVTLHTETAIFIVEKLTKAKYKITKDDNTNIIECEGIGFQNKFF